MKLKSKIICLLLTVPFLMSFQCDEDIIDNNFQTNLVVQNDSSFELLLEIVPNDISELKSQDSSYILNNASTTGFINPSEFESLTNLRLYRKDDSENFLLVYEQTPIQDSLWVINESTTRDVDHILIITDNKLGE